MPTPLDRLQTEMRRDIDELTRDAARGRIDPRTFSNDMVEILEEFHITSTLVASGRTRLADLDPQTRARLEETLDFHIGKAEQFAAEWARTGEWKNGYAARAHLYEGGIRTSYGLGQWNGIEGMASIPQPGQRSPCMSNCHCRWDSRVIDAGLGHVDMYWTLGASEHCGTCKERASRWNPLQVRFGEVVNA